MTAKEKPEFCAGVKILIERMETNPEDFGEDDYDFASMRKIRETKFGQLAKMLDQMLTGRDKAKLLEGWAEWHYLSKEEQTALLEAYKKMRRTQFDERIMKRVFDENFYQRQEDEEKARIAAENMKRQAAAQRLALQAQPGQLQAIATSTGTSAGGLLGSMGLGGIFR